MRSVAKGSEKMSALCVYRLLDLTSEKGALCTKILADLGADVIKIEPPAGDETRQIGPFLRSVPDKEASLRFASLNVNKRSITLNLETASGREVLKRLVSGADAVVESYASGYLESLGIHYSTIAAVNPSIVLTSITGFGQAGPYQHYEVNDLVALAMGGLLYICGEPGQAPCSPPESQAYYMVSLQAALGTLIALYIRRFSKRGQHVDVSMQDCLASQGLLISRFSEDRHIVRREGAQHAAATPGAIFRCRDGYIHLFVLDTWAAFLDWIGTPEGLKDDIWHDNQFRRANADVVNKYVVEFAASKTQRELVEQAQARHIPCTAVQSIADVASDPHLEARGFFLRTEHPVLGLHKYAGFPFRLTTTPCRVRRPAPMLGQHNEEIYGNELGLSRGDLSALRAAGVI